MGDELLSLQYQLAYIELQPTQGAAVMSSETQETNQDETAKPDEQETSARAPALKRAFAPIAAYGSSAYAAVREKSDQAMKDAEGYITRSPFQAVAYSAGAAVVIGVLVGELISRRNGGL